MGHHRWLPIDHPFRYDKEAFDRNMEFANSPFPLTGTQILAELDGTNFTYGRNHGNIDVMRGMMNKCGRNEVFSLILSIGSLTVFVIIWM